MIYFVFSYVMIMIGLHIL